MNGALGGTRTHGLSLSASGGLYPLSVQNKFIADAPTCTGFQEAFTLDGECFRLVPLDVD